MNSFGELLKLSIYGESHNEEIGLIIDNVPPGIKISEEDFYYDIDRRRPTSKFSTPRKESDKPLIRSGIYNNYTTGLPISISFTNTNTMSKDYDKFKSHPRPSTSDFVADKKYFSFNDFRGSGHFSGRLSVLLVAAGVIAKKVTSFKYNTCIMEAYGHKITNNDISAIDVDSTFGGVIQVTVSDMIVGLGEPFFSSVESHIAKILFSVPSVKGVSFGAGFAGTKLTGKEHNDVIISKDGKTETNNNGGINAGISNGNDLVINIGIKPISSVSKQKTFNFDSNSIEELVIEGRHDKTIVDRVMVVLENSIAFALADLYLLQKRCK